jgi:hypothetical protein
LRRRKKAENARPRATTVKLRTVNHIPVSTPIISLSSQRKAKGRGEELTTPRTPRHQRHRNPNQIRIPIQTSTFQQIRTLTPIPLQHRPQPHGHNPRIPIHQPRSPTQQLKIIRKRRPTFTIFAQPTVAQVLVYCTGQEQDDDDGCSDPHRAV